ncbi:GTPase [Dactylosporangium cerinum]|uniref:GTPase n=1 Tax=Dactylosporangium cerinum TaxID=1434730 RepID=A0ABV9WID1_9ACTN
MAQLVPSSTVDRAGQAVADALAETLDDLARPMRLAVTGQLSRGKSTLVNALTRLPVAPTGIDEVTADYHEFRFDGVSVPAAPPPGGRRGRLPALVVSSVAAELPAPLRLIDTPGLGSPLTDTKGNAGLRTDAALHLFENNVHQDDQEYLRGLLGGDGRAMLPARVLAVISSCDLSWPPAPDRAVNGDPLTFDPLRDHAEPIIRQIGRNPRSHELFFAVLPVAALVAEGGWALTGDQIDVLAELAKRHDEPTLAGQLASKARFVGADIVADAATRRALLERLGLWGIHVACQYLRAAAATEAGLREHLDERSGVARLRATVVGHFVGRRGAIKLELHLRQIERRLAEARDAAQLHGTAMPAPLAEVAARVESLRAGNLGLSELALVQLIHRHQHRVSAAEQAELAALTGGDGVGCAPRLGLPADVGVARMLERAVELNRRWNQRTTTVPALAPSVVRAYERLIARVGEARALLDNLD